jgi:hypothetical protein
MKKKILIGLGILLFMNVAYATNYSQYYTDYYYNGSTYLVDGIGVDDMALNGLIPTHGDDLNRFGWSKLGTGVNYTDKIKSLGSIGINTSSGKAWIGQISGGYFMINNGTFSGSIGAKVYDVNGSSYCGMAISESGFGNAIYAYIDTRNNETHWTYDTDHVCDLNPVGRNISTWQTIEFNFHNYTQGTLYINDIACHNFTGWTGVDRVDIVCDIGVGQTFYFDEVWVSNGERVNTSISVGETYDTDNIEGDKSTWILNITKKIFNSSTTASLVYDGVEQNLTKSSHYYHDAYTATVLHPAPSGFNYTTFINWTYNYSGSSYKSSRNDTIRKLFVGYCNSTVNTIALNYSVKDAHTGNAITNYGFSSAYTIWNVNNSDYTKTFGLVNSSAISQTNICIYPSYGVYGTNYNALFTSEGYSSTNYIINSGYLNSTIQHITVYMTNSSLATAITVNLYDENDNYLSGYLVEVKKYDVATNSYILVDSKTIGSGGKAVFYLDVSTDEYQFVVKNPSGTIIYTQSKQILTQTEYTFRVVLGQEAVFIEKSIGEINAIITADRTNKVFYLNWSDIGYAVDLINFTVYRINATTNQTQLYTESSTSSSGGMLYQITETTTDTSVSYLANAFGRSIKNNQTYLITSKTMDFKKEWEIFGDESIMMSFLFIGTMMFLGLSLSAEAALIITGFAMVIFWFMGMYATSMSGLIAILVSLVVLFVRSKRS